MPRVANLGFVTFRGYSLLTLMSSDKPCLHHLLNSVFILLLHFNFTTLLKFWMIILSSRDWE